MQWYLNNKGDRQRTCQVYAARQINSFRERCRKVVFSIQRFHNLEIIGPTLMLGVHDP